MLKVTDLDQATSRLLQDAFNEDIHVTNLPRIKAENALHQRFNIPLNVAVNLYKDWQTDDTVRMVLWLQAEGAHLARRKTTT